jgi:hypothetical protein
MPSTRHPRINTALQLQAMPWTTTPPPKLSHPALLPSAITEKPSWLPPVQWKALDVVPAQPRSSPLLRPMHLLLGHCRLPPPLTDLRPPQNSPPEIPDSKPHESRILQRTKSIARCTDPPHPSLSKCKRRIAKICSRHLLWRWPESAYLLKYHMYIY